MTSIALQTAIERARVAALSGDPATFAELRRGILSLDRDSTAPVRELRMLGVVAAARLADVGAVETGLAALDPIGPRERSTLRAWLLAAPELELPAYAEFVQSLDRRMRQDMAAPPARRWTPALVIVLGGALLSLLLLGWRLTPASPDRAARDAIMAVLDGDATALADALPASWRGQVRQATGALAMHADPTLARETQAAVEQLAAAIEAAARGPAADAVARTLVGPRADGAMLARLAAGVRAINESGWLDPSAWASRAWSWRPEGDALLAHRTLLRHLPLGIWATGWFSAGWRCDPLGTQDVAVHPTASAPDQATVVVHVGLDSWPATLARRDRTWVPRSLLERWAAWQEALDPERCTPERTQSLQRSIIASLRAIAEWVGKAGTPAGSSAPASPEVPWWLP